MCVVEWKKLGEVMQIVRGASPRPINNYLTTDINGVNWIKIGDVSVNDKYITKTKEKITKEGASRSRYLKPGDFILSNSMSFGRPYILKTDGCIHDGWIAMSNFNEYLISGYLYEVLSSNEVQQYWKMKANNGGAMINLNSDIVRETLIPIPSLAKQQEIVSQLDTFTTLISNLESELDMRRKQYEHYRNQLLDFEGVEGVEWKTLGDLSLKITDGAHTSPKSTSEGYYMPSVKDMTDYGFDFSDCKIISEEDYEDLKRIGCQPNVSDILIAKDGSMLRYVFALKEKLDIVLLSSIAIITPKQELIMSEYLVHYLKQSSVREIVIRDYSSKGGVPRIILKNFKKIIIPTPAINIQQQIVEKLDAFEQLIQSLETEIKLRKQQYEYYREKLLTFE